MLTTLGDARRQRAVTRIADHRPWQMPDRPWFMAQTWRHLLFAHWRVDPGALARVLPPGLPLDTFDGAAWVGVTPFAVDTFRVRLLPPPPAVHSFPELNVRTYVTVDGRPGIWFFSLDAGSRLAVEGARRLYRLPYFRARASLDDGDPGVSFRSVRTQSDGPPASLRVEYRASGPAGEPVPGTLDHWLTERYCLYTVDARGRLLRGDIHHRPWVLAPATAAIGENTMGGQIGVELAAPPLLHVAAPQDVVFWRLAPAA
ncbi:MAG TPA: DUF2071 domain-containing protein [Thermoleophilaceae bacterium]|jgi:hypothetical protein